MPTLPSEPLRRVAAPRGLRACFFWGPVLAVCAGGCLFDLPPLQDTGIGGASGFDNQGGSVPIGGSAPIQGGSGNIGGSAGGAKPNDCQPDQKRCDGLCVPANEQNGCGSGSCQACPTLPHATTGCLENGQCAITGCENGFADCNGDSINDVGDIAGDGCEYALGVAAPSAAILSVPFAHIQIDGKREDWAAIPAYGFEKTCSNCKDQQTEPISADSSVPPRNDLDARFRVAWDADKLYLLYEAFDNQPYDGGVAGGHCQHPAECEDGVQVFLLGREDRSPDHDYFNDNMRFFLGLSERVGAPGQGQPAASDVEVKAEHQQGSLCYRVEAQVDWAYITNTKNGGQAPGHFPPAVNQSYGFDIAANDWDAPISDPNGIQRQSQIFWSEPGNDLTQTEGIGTMTLVGGADAGP